MKLPPFTRFNSIAHSLPRCDLKHAHEYLGGINQDHLNEGRISPKRPYLSENQHDYVVFRNSRAKTP